MSFLTDIPGIGFLSDITGSGQSKAIGKGVGFQVDAGNRAVSMLDPFSKLGASVIPQAGFLTDPNAQFQFLQNNPLFKMGLDNANRVTQQSAAARGRLTSGDTLQQLSNNALLTASPLIGSQKQSIMDLLGLGLGSSAQQGQYITDIGAAQAAGEARAAAADLPSGGGSLCADQGLQGHYGLGHQ